ncbi:MULTISPECIES: hypothetical protein [Erythrobacteraceae]|uniref:Uncharacterized protein n=1 Tax=Erythrobacter westpacificensis TaxID=1055231 RepID=A0ABP9KAF2_9SPHN|nr:hypothetical protein [Aurantiacibacter odishensis]|tara:strand:+ start:339 stop:494 length:156 start_codon:yes stop_codon:yes gene_type:complete
MKLPKIDLASLPDLDTLTGLFGSIRTPGHDDTIIVIATVVYDTNPPGSGLI